VKPKKYPTHPDELAYLEAMMSPDPAALPAFFKAAGIEIAPDVPVSLHTIAKEEWTALTKVLPTPEMQRYLDSEDVLTQHTIEMMEGALETFYGVARPWAIIAETTGKEEEENLAVDHFYLEFFVGWKEGDC
jgi:hypothetical protein